MDQRNYQWLKKRDGLLETLMAQSPDEIKAISIILGEQDYDTTKERILATCLKLDNEQTEVMFKLLSIVKGLRVKFFTFCLDAENSVWDD